MWSLAAVALKKSNVFSTSSSTLSVIALQHRPRIVVGDAARRSALLQLLGGLERQVQLLLHGFGEGVAAHRDVAGEHRLRAGEDVDVDGARAGVEQHDDARGLEAVVGFVGVLQREGVDVDDDRRAAGLRDDAGVVGDLVFLGRDQQHFHRPLAVRAGAGVDDFVVEIDVLDVERDVLLRLPVDRLDSSCSLISGSVIFLTMTELPDSEAATSLALELLVRRTAGERRRPRRPNR